MTTIIGTGEVGLCIAEKSWKRCSPKIWEKAKLAEDTIGYSILKQGYLSDFEAEFAKLKEKALPPTEKAKPQTFWAAARKLIRDDDDLPCECSF